MPWTKIALTGGLLLGLTSCATTTHVIPPITVAPRLQDSPSPDVWLGGLTNAYRDNCVVLSVMRHEDPQRCRQP